MQNNHDSSEFYNISFRIEIAAFFQIVPNCAPFGFVLKHFFPCNYCQFTELSEFLIDL